MKQITRIALLATRHDGLTHRSTDTTYKLVAKHPDGTKTEVELPFTAGKILELHPMLLTINAIEDKTNRSTPDFALSPEFAKFLNEDYPKRWLMKDSDWD